MREQVGNAERSVWLKNNRGSKRRTRLGSEGWDGMVEEPQDGTRENEVCPKELTA
jgi:hypothetical protein